jgi:hypothetical protein
LSTKEQLQAENERLGAEVAACRVLLTVVAEAKLPPPADGDSNYENYLRDASSRLADVTIIVRAVMKYAGDVHFARIVHDSAATLSRELARPAGYVAEGSQVAVSVTA